MKRSEMIKLITEVLESFKRIVEADDDAKAVALLTVLEEAGMQPPPYKAKALIGFYEVQDWEPENEKK